MPKPRDALPLDSNVSDRSRLEDLPERSSIGQRTKKDSGLHFTHRLISDDCLCDEALTSLSVFGKVEVKLERRWLHSQDELKGASMRLVLPL